MIIHDALKINKDNQKFEHGLTRDTETIKIIIKMTNNNQKPLICFKVPIMT